MNIVITGASRGIGFELAKIFCLNTNNTIVITARSIEKLNELKQACIRLNPNSKIIPIACDLSNSDAVSNFILELNKHLSTIDILINNAGAIVNKPFLELSQADIEHVYKVNVFSVIALIQNLLPYMEQKTKSHIVNISSIGGFQGSAKFAGLSAYSSSKAALTCLTECLAEEFKDMNTAFNCLALGATQTEMLEEAFPGYKAPITAAQMAEYIADFSKNAQKYMNGKIIPVSLSTP
ncbi:MAG: SDR family oxidoreductase [Bacteroidetes bacterium]|nr:SDR family oxidoreductase [Bacteroidota bacterium]